MLHAAQTALRPFAFPIALLACVLLGGCQAHVHRVGLGPSGIGEDSSRQLYLFFGLVRINEVDPQRMAKELTSYDISSEYGFLDLLLAPLLLPLTMTSRTVTVRT